ncbi:glycogen branching protein [Burkholderia pseudomallei]|nr:glycogen branching protein [Burkholderia pseudomallei]
MNRHWPSIRRIKLADNRRGVVIGSIESASAAALGSTHAASASPSRRRPASPRIESAGAGHAASRTPHATRHTPHAAWRMARVACRVSRVACRVSRVACRVSRVACRVSRVACRVSRVAGGASPGCAAREAHASARARRAVSAPPGSRSRASRHRLAAPWRAVVPPHHAHERQHVGDLPDVDRISIGCRSSGGVRRAMPKDLDSTPAPAAPAHEATRAAWAAHACAHMDSPARARGELRACRAPRARPPCRSSSRRAGRSAPAAPRRARRRRPRAASPCLARPIRSCPSGRPDKRPRSDRG